MTKKTFNIVIASITIVSLLAAFALTSMSMEISKNKATNKARSEVLGTWTDTANPQMIIQFTNENQYKVMGETQATYVVDPNNSIITLSFLPDFGGMNQYYTYGFNDNHSQLIMTNVDTGESISYTR